MRVSSPDIAAQPFDFTSDFGAARNSQVRNSEAFKKALKSQEFGNLQKSLKSV
jgi:hypothetical protein